jgi:Ice-binding-like
MTIGPGGILYLRGKGVYIFQMGTGLTVGDGASVVLLGGAKASDIFWNVGSLASFGSTAAWSGTIMAGTLPFRWARSQRWTAERWRKPRLHSFPTLLQYQKMENDTTGTDL